MTIYTAIFGPYDILKEPSIITDGWKYVCFTDQDISSNTWEIRRVKAMPEGGQRTARYFKIMFHKHIEDSRSIWIDASFKVNCNLDGWIQKMKSAFTVVTHPERDCVYDEIMACIDRRKDDPTILMKQFLRYKEEIKIPAHNGLISTGVLMRDNTPSTVEVCEFWYRELKKYSVRDQISLAYAMFHYQGLLSQIRWDYNTQKEFMFSPHVKWNR